MDSASFEFVIFGLFVALVSNLGRSSAWRATVLTVASICFLGFIDPFPFVFVPLLGFLVVGYAGVFLLERGKTRLRAWAIISVLLIYVWMKKYSFLPEGMFLHFSYFTLGLSYILFRVLHLLVEAGESDEPRQISLGAYLLYTLNFTTFVSGPIQRYNDFARDQFSDRPIPLGPGEIGIQLERIVRGFFKVNVLAMILNAVQVDTLVQLSQPLPRILLMLAAFRLIVVYPLFLYANFSGYIDIVIALARLMGLRLPENFDHPFSASSVIEFWSRWHITLSNWLKTYVFNPLLLALMRRITSPMLQPMLAVFCFFATFFLIGIWHGRTSEFLMFGALTGGGVSINKLWQLWMTRALGGREYKKLARYPAYVAFGRGLNFVWFALTLFWFWADWKTIDRIYRALSLSEWICVWLAIWPTATSVLALWEWLRQYLMSIRSSEGPIFSAATRALSTHPRWASSHLS